MKLAGPTKRRFEWEAERGSFDPKSFYAMSATVNETEFLGKPPGYWFCFGIDGVLHDASAGRWRLTMTLGLAIECEILSIAPNAYDRLDWWQYVPEPELLEVIG